MEKQKSLIETSKEERVKEVLKKENSSLEESLRRKLDAKWLWGLVIYLFIYFLSFVFTY